MVQGTVIRFDTVYNDIASIHVQLWHWSLDLVMFPELDHSETKIVFFDPKMKGFLKK